MAILFWLAAKKVLLLILSNKISTFVLVDMPIILRILQMALEIGKTPYALFDYEINHIQPPAGQGTIYKYLWELLVVPPHLTERCLSGMFLNAFKRF